MISGNVECLVELSGLMKHLGGAFLLMLGISSLASTLACAQPSASGQNVQPDTPPAVRAQIDKLYSRDAVARATAAHELGGMGRKAVMAVPFLIAMLEDNVALRAFPSGMGGTPTSPGEEAIGALGSIGDKQAVGPLIGILRGKDLRSRRELAAEALGNIGDTRAVPALIDALQLQDNRAAKQAAWALGKLKDPQAVEALIASLGRPEVQQAAEVALKQIGDHRAVEPLIRLLQDRTETVRFFAMDALGDLGDPRAMEALVGVALRDQDLGARRAAANALRKIGGGCGVESLISALEDQNGNTQDLAWRALVEITDNDLGRDAKEWRKWWADHKKNEDRSDPGRRSIVNSRQGLGGLPTLLACLGALILIGLAVLAFARRRAK